MNLPAASVAQNKKISPPSPFTVRDVFSGRVNVALGTPNALAAALEFRTWCRAMFGSAPDLAEAVSPKLDEWAAANPGRVRAETLSGFSCCDSSGLYDFAAAIWSERSAPDALRELGIGEELLRLAGVPNTKTRFAYLDFVSSGPAWGQGYAQALTDRACSEALIRRYSTVLTKAPTLEIGGWLDGRGFRSLGLDAGGACQVMARRT